MGGGEPHKPRPCPVCVCGRCAAIRGPADLTERLRHGDTGVRGGLALPHQRDRTGFVLSVRFHDDDPLVMVGARTGWDMRRDWKRN